MQKVFILASGEWVLVMYDGVIFPGEVKVTESVEVKVSVVVYFKWPPVEDAIFYKMF
jgi:hypothetical protein